MHAIVLAVLFYVGARCQDVIESTFSTEKILCDVNERLHRGCSSEMGHVRSMMECVLLCGRDTSCIGASLNENGLCYHHKECPFVPECTTEERNHLFLSRYCAHGTWDHSSQACKCVDGFFGDKCQQCHAGCSDLFGAGYTLGRHVVFIDPDQNGTPFRVICSLGGEGWSSVEILRTTGSMDFNKTWNQYVEGFYYDFDNFWTGLYAMHRVTKAGCNRMLFTFTFSTTEDRVVCRNYKEVFVANETNKYSFSIKTEGIWNRGSVPSGSYFGDCLGPLQDRPFSTWDADVDGDSTKTCAARAGFGWWFDGCNIPCNILGAGPQYLDILPRHQVFSLLGVDMSGITSGKPFFLMYIKCPDGG